MLGNFTEIVSLLSNKDKLADRIKAEVPGLLKELLKVVSAECGATEDMSTSVEFFQAKTPNGTTIMARVHRIDAAGQLGEELGVIDVPAALRAVPNEVITNMLPF